MRVKEIVEMLKKRGMTSDESIEFIHLITKLQSSDHDRKKIETLPAGLHNLHDALTIVNDTLLKNYIT